MAKKFFDFHCLPTDVLVVRSTISTVQELVRFGWMMLVAVDPRHRWLTVVTLVGEFITVYIAKMSLSLANLLQARKHRHLLDRRGLLHVRYLEIIDILVFFSKYSCKFSSGILISHIVSRFVQFSLPKTLNYD